MELLRGLTKTPPGTPFVGARTRPAHVPATDTANARWEREMERSETPGSETPGFSPPRRALIQLGARQVIRTADGDRDDHLLTRPMLGARKGTKATPRPLSAETPAELAHRHALLLAVDMSAIDADAADAQTALGVAKGQLAVLTRELELLAADEPDRPPIAGSKGEGAKAKPAKGKPAEPASDLPPCRPRDDEPSVRAVVVAFQRLVADLAREVAAIGAAGARAEVLRNADRLAEQSVMNNTLHRRVLDRTMRQLSRTQGPDVLVVDGDTARGGSSRATYRKGQSPLSDARRRGVGLAHSRSLPEIRALRKPALLDRSPTAAHAPLKSHWDSAAVPRCITRAGLSASFVGNLRPAKWVSAGAGTDPAKLCEWLPEPEAESPSARRLRSLASAESLAHAASARDSPLAKRSLASIPPLRLHVPQPESEQSRAPGAQPGARARRSIAASQSLPEIRRRTQPS